MKHAVLMGKPDYFRIKGGLNPHTRNAWGVKKKVNLPKAVKQWHGLKDTIEKIGGKVYVMDAHPDFPGMVYPANAGFVYPKENALPFSQKMFYLSTLAAAHRKGEKNLYLRFLKTLGFRLEEFEYPFEGEADFFPCGEYYLFTYGNIAPTGFKPRTGWPPYRFQFSHRSDARNADRLRQIVSPKIVLPVRLVDPVFYHGDTALFTFGPKRDNLFVYPKAIDAESFDRLKKHFGQKLFIMDDKDAKNFTANAFQMETPQGPHMIFPANVSSNVRKTVNETGVLSTQVDVSEFYLKGGGSVKCLLCDLGPDTTT